MPGVQTQRVADGLGADRVPQRGRRGRQRVDVRRADPDEPQRHVLIPAVRAQQPPTGRRPGVGLSRPDRVRVRDPAQRLQRHSPTQRHRVHHQAIRVPGLLPPQRQQQLLDLREGAGELLVPIRQHHHPLAAHWFLSWVPGHRTRLFLRRTPEPCPRVSFADDTDTTRVMGRAVWHRPVSRWLLGGGVSS